MWDLKACTVCFSTNVNLYSLNDGTLRKDFNLVSGLKIVQENGMPEYLCVECRAYVAKFKTFRNKCHRAHYALEQLLTKNKEIKKSDLEEFDGRQLNIMPTLSYMNLDRSNYSQFQFEMVDYYRNGTTPIGQIPIVHCTTLTPEDTFELEMKDVSQEEINKHIKIEIEQNRPEIVIEPLKINRVQDDNDSSLTETGINFTDDEVSSKALTFEIDNGHDFPANNDFDDETEAEDDKFEADSCTFRNKAVGVRYSDKCGDVVPMTVKEAKAAVEVYKYTSVGPLRCHCGKAFIVEKNYKTHCRRHDLHVSGTYHCEICDYYFKTAFLLQCHMSDQHMYKYLCVMCPQVSFTKPSAKQHYMSHVKPDRGDGEQDKKDAVAVKKPSWITPTTRGGARIKGTGKVKAKKASKKQPKDFPIYSPQSPLEQYEMVLRRKESRNYLEAKFKCELCYRGYRLTSTYNKHMAKHDPTISGCHQCDMCKHHFRDTRRLYKHMIMYHLFKYSCRLCEFVTTNKGQAIYHYRWHKNVTYDCPHCDKKFSKITTQMTHIRFKHPGTDVCNICGHSFISSSGLNFHKLVSHSKREIETSEAMVMNPDAGSPYHCAECRLQFVTEQAYVTHLGSSKKHVEINISSQSVMKCKSRASRAEPGTEAEPGAPATGARRRRAADSQVLNTGVTTSTHCNVEAGQLLVEYYSALRSRDGGAGGGAWRITVRQLESMVRLAEAMAKMHCSGHVAPHHVHEAYRLLNKSIIRVEQPDIHLDEDDPQYEPSMDVDQEYQDIPNGTAETPVNGDGPKKKLTLSFEEYKSLSDMLVVFMRKEEQEAETRGSESAGMRKSAVVSWYLEQLVSRGTIENEDELLERKTLVEKVIDRLMYHDQVIIPLSTTGLRATQKSTEPETEDDPLLVVHPNYVVDT